MTWTTTPPHDPPIALLLAARDPGPLYAAFLDDPRFQVQATARTPDELQEKLALQPDALLLEGTLFPSPQELADTLAPPCLLLLPEQTPAESLALLQALPNPVAIHQGEPRFPELADTLAQAVASRRPGPAPAPLPAAAAGWRAVAVWSLAGGVGKSTLAVALALEAVQRRLPTLLVGLGAPDTLPLLLDRPPQPNLLAWRRQPTTATLQAAVQSQHGLDLLAGFPSPLDLAAYLPEALDGGASLPALTQAAAHAGYAVVVLDVSAQELAPAALAAANALLLVAVPTLPGLALALEAHRLVQELHSGRHPIPPQDIHLLFNRVRPSTLTPEQALKSARQLGQPLPPLAAAIPDDPAIQECAQRQQPAAFHSHPLRLAMKRLADALFAPGPPPPPPPTPGRVYTLGPLRVRV